ncbi:hypothetical protein EG829_23695, partial [bacterium]|nr:hypothetical protein [bacterium]
MYSMRWPTRVSGSPEAGGVERNGGKVDRTMKTDFWYRFSKNRLAVAGSVIVVFLFIVS